MACEIDHAKGMRDEHLKAIEDLPRSQKGTWRHHCACCAFLAGYERGFSDGRGQAAKESAVDESATQSG